MLHGFGVVYGLVVSVADRTDATVIISPGFALDRSGNEITVEGPIRIDLNVCTGDMCFVTIQYTEIATKNGGFDFSGVTEGSAVLNIIQRTVANQRATLPTIECNFLAYLGDACVLFSEQDSLMYPLLSD